MNKLIKFYTTLKCVFVLNKHTRLFLFITIFTQYDVKICIFVLVVVAGKTKYSIINNAYHLST